MANEVNFVKTEPKKIVCLIRVYLWKRYEISLNIGQRTMEVHLHLMRLRTVKSCP